MTIMTTKDLEARLAAKYSGEAYVMLWEVRDSTGFSNTGREADAMAFGVWPSRGLLVEGFEIKSSRQDWLRELQNPAKSESFVTACDFWWLVTAPDVSNLSEIPATWGWLVANGNGLKVMKPAPQLTPREMGRPLLMSIVRNIARNYVPASKVKEQVEQRAEELSKQRRENNSWRLQELEKIDKRVKDFEAATGVSLADEWSWPPKETGAIVRMVLDGMLKTDLENVLDAAKKTAEIITALQAMPLLKKADKEMKSVLRKNC